jgi:hypothetical protein
MRTKTYTVYEFHELNPKARANAIELLRNVNTDYDWWDYTYDYFVELCRLTGISIHRSAHKKQGRYSIWFSDFYSQCDGSSYQATVDVAALVKAVRGQAWSGYAPQEKLAFTLFDECDEALKYIDDGIAEVDCEVCPSNRETAITTNFTWRFTNPDIKDMLSDSGFKNITKAMLKLERHVSVQLIGMNKFLFKKLEKECNYLTSDEAIVETIEANAYEFTELGSLD